ncbi:type IV conjugative transfer system protein TraE [Actimicrobium sp. CCI2.3]|uniref:type IV conjugative transfer system protein TraE n=1 Tax=Actimicrobium sp. CCI2.3 TaxID=3048616 RepID=UPI002AB49DC2|nr:type IV conjugative transfer system protein TraE [Actimicrobium sp. CCI2.3]MDY7574437.1 type IV conjugative transfer system protein TraE [Actimicrobium sp. CCI2.3]MEB0022485.1 type IV conjugative transfer system protein TraE [Actimicrobium sp. CCI2.3]
MLALCIVSALLFLRLAGNEKIIVVPPTIDKTFWVGKDRVSASYLEQMGAYTASLILDVTANNIDWKRDVLLQYVTPETTSALRTRQDIEADRLKKINAATFFAVQQFFTSEDTLSVVIKGRLVTIINGSRVETDGEGRAYLVAFQYSGNRIQLHTFKEIPYENPGTNHAALLADRGSLRD